MRQVSKSKMKKSLGNMDPKMIEKAMQSGMMNGVLNQLRANSDGNPELQRALAEMDFTKLTKIITSQDTQGKIQDLSQDNDAFEGMVGTMNGVMGKSKRPIRRCRYGKCKNRYEERETKCKSCISFCNDCMVNCKECGGKSATGRKLNANIATEEETLNIDDDGDTDVIDEFGLLDIAGNKCNTCGGKSDLKCARCHNVHYCSRACQIKDWPTHKLICNK